MALSELLRIFHFKTHFIIDLLFSLTESQGFFINILLLKEVQKDKKSVIFALEEYLAS
jgi:hypothetical protein